MRQAGGDEPTDPADINIHVPQVPFTWAFVARESEHGGGQW